MARFFRESGDCPLHPTADIWIVLAEVDTYLRTKADGDVLLRAHDARGLTESAELGELQAECELHGTPVDSFHFRYSNLDANGVWFEVSIYDLNQRNQARSQVRVIGHGLDVALVRGAVAEAIDRAKAVQPAIAATNTLDDDLAETPSTRKRVYTAREQADMDPDLAWEILEFADAVARAELGGSTRSRVRVTDDRGDFQRDGVQAARTQWEQDRRPLSRIWLSYDVGDSDLPNPDIYCEDLDETYRRFMKPKFRVSVSSTSFSAAESLARKLLQVAEIKPQPADPLANAEMAKSNTEVANQAKLASRWKQFLNHQYAVQIIGGLVVGLIILFFTLALT